MIKEILLNKEVKLIAGDNIVNGCTYVSLCFVGGYSSEKLLELSHLSEHMVIGFNYLVGNKLVPNRYMLNMRADARTKDDRVEFTFCVTDEAELKEKLDVLINCFNNIVITEEALEKEKVTLINELYQENVTEDYIKKVEKAFKKVKVEDVLDYIGTNYTLDNLTVFVVGQLKEKVLTKNFNKFVGNLKSTGIKNKIKPNIKKDWEERGFLEVGKKQAVEIVAEITPLVCPKTKKEELLFDLIVSYLNNFVLGIKRVLRHEKRLVYRTSIEKTKNRDKIVTAAFCKKEDIKTVQSEIENYYKNLFANGVGRQEFEIVKATKIDFLMSRPIHLTSKLLRDIGDLFLAENNVNADEVLQQEFIKLENESIIRFNPKQVKEQIKILKSLKYKQFNRYLQSFKGCKLSFIKED